MNQYNAIDLFCGAGGLSYGFECAGFNILLGIDNDQKALEVFERNHKGAKSICGDITQIDYEQIKEKIGDKRIDIIIGGPPCQGMSLSGPRKFDDPRNKLYLSYIRLVDEIKPRAFVIENVPGLVSLFNGQIKDSIIEKFTAMGYKVKYQILCASDYGVPQNRKRVVFVGTREDVEFEYPEKISEQVTCKMALSDLPPLEDELGEDISDYATEPTNSYQKLMRKPKCFIAENVKGLLTANKKEAFPLIIKEFEESGYNVTYHVLKAVEYGVPQKRERVIIVGFKKELGIKFDFPNPVIKREEDYVPLKEVIEANVDEKYFFSQRAVDGMMRNRATMNKGRAQNIEEPCNTVGAHLAKVSLNSTDPVLMEGGRYRRFTPREVARIQSFPDTFKLIESESAQYRALGNAIPPVMFWYVMRAVKLALEQ